MRSIGHFRDTFGLLRTVADCCGLGLRAVLTDICEGFVRFCGLALFLRTGVRTPHVDSAPVFAIANCFFADPPRLECYNIKGGEGRAESPGPVGTLFRRCTGAPASKREGGKKKQKNT